MAAAGTAIAVLSVMPLEASALPNVARVLIYSATRDFRHDSIPTAVDALVSHGPAANISFDHTEDQTWFTDDRLQQYDAILFLSNTGEGKNPHRFLLDFQCMLSCLESWTKQGKPRLRSTWTSEGTSWASIQPRTVFATPRSSRKN